LSPTPDTVDDRFRVLLSDAAQGLEDIVEFGVDAGTQKIGQWWFVILIWG
jgi:hypothetical protein